MSIESDRYKITKNDDMLLLTDKKTLKARKLEPEDVDYVIDDNQKIRDSSIIENYFRLKDEPYEAKMNTKTADYVKEQKEADKYGVRGYTDIIEQFIKKFNLQNDEIKKLADFPDVSGIRKFNNRGDADKRTIINDFKNLSKELSEDKKITDTFTYLKTYFKNYLKNIRSQDGNHEKTNTLINYLKDSSHYSVQDFRLLNNTDINDLYDIYRANVEKFENINLEYLNNWCNRIRHIYQIIYNKGPNNILQFYYYAPEIQFTNNPELFNHFDNKLTIIPSPEDLQIYQGQEYKIPLKYQKITTESENYLKENNIIRIKDSNLGIKYPKNFMAVLLLISNPILDGIIRVKKENVANFDMLKLVKKIVEKGLGYFNKPDKIKYLITVLGNNPPIDKYNFKCKVYSRTFSSHINFNAGSRITVISGTHQNFNNTNDYIKDTQKLSNTGKDIANQVKSILEEINKPSNNVGEGIINEGSGWTDKTLTRIEKITDILKGYGDINFGEVSSGLEYGSGWTDKTLTRIEKITDILKGYGRINPYLLKVASKYSSGKCAGWTDKTLTRIEKITDILKEY